MFKKFLQVLILLLVSCAPYSLPEKESNVQKDNAFKFYTESIAFYHEQDFETALKQINRAIEINPRFYQFLQHKGDIYRKMNEPGLAIKSYEEAIQFRSNARDAYTAIAEIYREQGKYDLAVSYYKKSLVDDVNLYPVYLEITECYLSAKDYIFARNSLEEYRKLANSLGRQPQPRYYFLAGKTLYLQKNYKASLEELHKVLAQDSFENELLALIGKNYYALNEFENGLKYFNILLRKDDSNGEWYYYRGVYFYMKNNFNDARSHFERALSFNSEIAGAHYFLAKIYVQNGNIEQALHEFKLYRLEMKAEEELRAIDDAILRLEEMQKVNTEPVLTP